MSTTFDEMWSDARAVLNDMHGEAVTLSGPEGSTSITASWYVDANDNTITRTASGITAAQKRKWTVAKAAYLIGSRTTPARGDRLTDSSSIAWELLPDDKQEAWQDMGADWLLLTKKVT